MPGFAGFDRDIYPGDDVLDWLKANTNLHWVGSYLAPTPSHQDTTWMGKLDFLQSSGWGVAPIFVGEQVVGPGSRHPSAAKGTTDGQHAVALLISEGFAPGTFVFLDLENGMPFPQSLQDYATHWAAAVVAGGFGAGMYCSHNLALVVHNLVPKARIWSWNVATIASHPVPCPYPDPNPSGCGYIGAYAWQLGQNCIATVPVAAGGVLDVDLDTALTPNPAAP